MQKKIFHFLFFGLFNFNLFQSKMNGDGQVGNRFDYLSDNTPGSSNRLDILGVNVRPTTAQLDDENDDNWMHFNWGSVLNQHTVFYL